MESVEEEDLCIICCDDIEAEDFICCHRCGGRTHTSCLSKAFLVGRLEPSYPCCGSLVPNEHLGMIMDDSMLRKLEFYQNKRKYVQRNDVVFCIKEDCWNPIFCEDDTRVGTVCCPRCGTEVCRSCESAAHGGISCIVPKESCLDTLAARIRLIKTKTCPQCHIRIEKNDGCNHIYCTRCGIDFCWFCRGLLYRSKIGLRNCRCIDTRLGLHILAVGTVAVCAIPLAVVGTVVLGPPYLLYNSTIRKCNAQQNSWGESWPPAQKHLRIRDLIRRKDPH